MEKKIYSFLKDYNLLTDKPIICAVSGGVDSVCLITILHNLGLKVVLAHVNHHKRAQSEIEEKAMKDYAKKLNVDFELLSYHYDHTDNFHNAAHNARYNFFKELCSKYNTNIIATAHHLDDQIETILIKIMEGSNLYGYGGISICNDDGKYKIIRPLLISTKDELYQYAKDKKLIFFEDSSNFEDDFLRNRLRHHVIPLLKQETPDLAKKVFQYSLQVKEAFDFIRTQSIDYLKNTNNKIVYQSFISLDIALKKDIISLLLENADIKKNNRLIINILELISSNGGGHKELKLGCNYFFIKEYDDFYLLKKEEAVIKAVQVDLDREGIFNQKYRFYFTKKVPNTDAKYIKLCYNNIKLPFIVRSKEIGDTISMQFGNKRLSRLLIDQKIDKLERTNIPVICNADNEILWVYNYAKANSVFDQKENGDIYFVCEEGIYE